MSRPPNILLLAVDSLRRDHMSGYGYPKLTTPHLDRFARDAALFEGHVSAHIPTTPAYGTLLTGRDAFGTQVVALRHQGPLTPDVKTLAEILRGHGYDTTCVGFTGNPSARGFDRYLDFGQTWGGWNQRPLRKAEELNKVFLPELDRLHAAGKPWMVMLRHMDPHAPYLPPPPYDALFFGGDPCAPGKTTMDPVKAFKPFRDFHLSWSPPGITDADFLTAQYDGELAYLDACVQVILARLAALGAMDDTIVVLTGDHGETLYEHECWFDHHGMYEPTLVVPLVIRFPAMLPAGKRIPGVHRHQDVVPTLLELAGLEGGVPCDGRSLLPLVAGKDAGLPSEFYITECTWMRKHGWRTPEWKLIVALEPDFHFKPEVELYNLKNDPGELRDVAQQRPEIVEAMRKKMDDWIARRERETGKTNPMLTQGDWHGVKGLGPFKTSQQAYDTLYIGDADTARRLQEGEKKK
ncbi:MAG: sulfatase [bacterium]